MRKLSAPMEALDRAVLIGIELDVLHPAVIVKVLEKAIRQLRPQEDDDSAGKRQEIQKDLAKVEAALARLTQAVAEGGRLATLLGEMKKYEDQRTRLATELAMLDGLAVTPFDPVRVEEELRGYLKDWSGLAQQHPARTSRSFGSCCPTGFGSGAKCDEARRFTGSRGKLLWVSFSTAMDCSSIPPQTKQDLATNSREWLLSGEW